MNSGIELTHRRVLVLNKHWLAVHVCSVRRAITMLYQDLAQVVLEDYRTYDFDTWIGISEGNGIPADHAIRAPNFRLRVPQVIVLRRYHSTPPRTVRFNRRNIFLRDRHQCQYCGEAPGHEHLTIDHVTPRSRGGRSDWKNIVVACIPCNIKKGDRFPSECGMYPSAKPKRPSWLMTLRVTPNDEDRNVWSRFVNGAAWELNEGK